jgi:hypothetical protein
MSTPFSYQPYSTVDFRNALSDIKNDISNIEPLIDKYERTNSPDDEAKMLIALSGLEIKMSNFARDMRNKLT